MTFENITTIWKQKGSKMDMNSERGIFILTVLKKCLDKLIFFDNVDEINENMSDSNIGGRKNRNIKNHLFIIYGIINSVVKGKEDCVDIQIYDIEKCFDGLWLEDCLNDIYDVVPKDNKNDKLALMYESNKKNLVSINTAVGLTERTDIPNIVQQGGTWGSALCSNSIDTLGKKCQDRDNHNYYYKNISRVLIFAMCDDLNGVARCGIESVELNTYITTQIELKRLRFHIPDKNGKSKCHKIHVGKKSNTCPVLKVHDTVMETVDYDTYLGDVISGDGKNTRTIKKRVSKGIGIITQIINLLDSITLGQYYIEIALLLRESLFINGVLTNAEIWYSLSSEEIKEFEDLDKSLLRKILRVPFSTPGEAYFLELGIIPLGVTIKARRINYLYYLLSRREDEMLSTFFKTQWFNEIDGDWTRQIKLDLDAFNIPCDFEYIRAKSKTGFKNMVKIRARELALQILQNKQNSHSKMSNLYYPELKLQDCYKIEGIQTKEVQNLFKWRVKMAPFGENFRGNNLNVVCKLCHSHLDNQSLIFQCEAIRNNMDINCNISDIYCNTIRLETVKKICEIEETREKLLEEINGRE